MFALIPSVGLQRSDVTCRMSIGCCVEVTRFPSDVLSLDLSERHWKVILNRVSTCTSDRDAWWCTGVLLDAVTSLLAVVTGGTGWNAAARFLNVWPETVVHDDNLLLIVKVLICKQVKLQLKSTFLTESHWTHHRGRGLMTTPRWRRRSSSRQPAEDWNRADRSVKVTWGRRLLSGRANTHLSSQQTVFFMWTWSAAFSHFLFETSINWQKQRRTNVYEWKKEKLHLFMFLLQCAALFTRSIHGNHHDMTTSFVKLWIQAVQRFYCIVSQTNQVSD